MPIMDPGCPDLEPWCPDFSRPEEPPPSDGLPIGSRYDLSLLDKVVHENGVIQKPEKLAGEGKGESRDFSSDWFRFKIGEVELLNLMAMGHDSLAYLADLTMTKIKNTHYMRSRSRRVGLSSPQPSFLIPEIPVSPTPLNSPYSVPELSSEPPSPPLGMHSSKRSFPCLSYTGAMFGPCDTHRMCSIAPPHQRDLRR